MQAITLNINIRPSQPSCLSYEQTCRYGHDEDGFEMLPSYRFQESLGMLRVEGCISGAGYT